MFSFFPNLHSCHELPLPPRHTGPLTIPGMSLGCLLTASPCSVPAGEHVRLWTRSLLPSVPLHPAARPAAPPVSSRRPAALSHASSSTQPPSTPPKLFVPDLTSPSLPLLPSKSKPRPFKAPDIVLGINGTSHQRKSEAPSAALTPARFSLCRFSGNSQMFVSSSQLTAHPQEDPAAPDRRNRQTQRPRKKCKKRTM